MRYVYPHLGGLDLGIFRIRGHGLGNLLFPWARATIAARDHQLVPIEPTWPQLKPGHFLRGESDYRTYCRLFRTTPNSITGLKKLWLLCRLPRLPEIALQHPEALPKGPFIVQLYGMDQLFKPLLGEHVFIKEKLLEIVLPEHRQGLNSDLSGQVGLHVRRGDFSKSLRAVPISWYCDVVDALTDNLGENVGFSVFSDGSAEELAPLVAKPNVSVCSFGSSIADLLALSRCRLLVGTAGSTFSMWAAFLGRMPTVWPHQKFHRKGGTPRLLYNNTDAEIEWMPPSQMQPAFLELSKRSIEG